MNKNTIWIIATSVLGLILLGAVYYIYMQQATVDELVEQFNIEKEELTDEYTQMAVQYEGYQLTVAGNDSLLVLLDEEQAKVQRLLQELKSVKASDAAEIRKLKKELETVRGVMRIYVRQIDSLNVLNQQLTAENIEIKGKYNEATRTVSNLSVEKEKLAERVTIASKLEATSLTITPINKRGKAEKRIKSMEQIMLQFTIAKNITASTGEKVVYVRISTPDGQLLTKSSAATFAYEDQNIGYSIKRIIEYTSEELPVTVYWKIEEFLFAGSYRVDIFTDGYRIGGGSFTLK